MVGNLYLGITSGLPGNPAGIVRILGQSFRLPEVRRRWSTNIAYYFSWAPRAATHVLGLSRP